MEKLKKVNKIIIHHSQSEKISLNKIRELHVNIRGWEDIGYHYIIGNKSEFVEDGKIYKGREKKFVGAHVFGQNFDSIGICLMGNLDINPPTKKQIQSLIKLLKELLKEYNLSVKDIKCHNEFPEVIKSCPGKNFDLEKVKKHLE